MIRAENIQKNFGSLQVLKGVNLHIAPNEIVTITGASGAGKTTLLQILGTLDKPDAGTGNFTEKSFKESEKSQRTS